ncbi:hypothetical protein R3P38DRAFT_2922546 [Favolaschia claudopus]|uniref:Uncharacterized protein n=1 Tax=Favolaschia claudopus TaxID=2862362 RepID=A0AAW0C313_9AGAR
MQTAAKRLVKPLYHSLVCTFLEQNSGQPLSADILVKYVSYLQECCVPQSTKFTIVNDLYHRAKQVRGDAQAIIDSPVVLHLKQMLHTLDGQEDFKPFYHGSRGPGRVDRVRVLEFRCKLKAAVPRHVGRPNSGMIPRSYKTKRKL